MDGIYPQGCVQRCMAVVGHSDCYRRLGDRDMCPHRMDADKERQERDGGPYAHGKQECCPEGNPQQVGRPSARHECEHCHQGERGEGCQMQ